ncbi:MAG: hypothetical protein HY303_14830 [Candidatus Wallbacteria bacterium]|nr:hypothetical protein [Candidatus Wallbacteria bacterium]
MRRRHDTARVIWDLAAFLGKRGWTVDEVSPPPAVCIAGRWVLATAFLMVFVDGTARGSGRPAELVGQWIERLPEALNKIAKGQFAGAMSTILALCFCDLPEPIATEALGCKQLRVFRSHHGFCRSVDFEECTVREHVGIPFFSGHGTADIAEFLDQWRIFSASE